MTRGTGATPPPPSLQRFPLILFLVLGATLACRHQGLLEPDQVAQHLLARHLQAGRFDLGLSTYWGPLQPTLLALLGTLGLAETTACRILQMGWGFLLVHSGLRLASVLGLRPLTLGPVGLALALQTSAFAAYYGTADLALAALVTAAAASLWEADRSTTWKAGVLLGLALLAKSAALPVAFLLLAGTAATEAGLARQPGGSAPRRALRVAAITVLVAGPWFLFLSGRAGKPLLSSAATLNHALLGPAVSGDRSRPETFRGHPTFSTLHRVREGRISSWEDPGEISDRYPTWSPLSTPGGPGRQLRYTLSALDEASRLLARFDGLGLALVTTVGLALWAAIRRPRGPAEDVLPAIGMLAIVLPYLPFFVQWRYLWGAFPFLLAGLGRAADRLLAGSDIPTTRTRIARAFLLAPPVLVGLGLVLLGLLVFPPSRQAQIATRLAAAIPDSHRGSPIAGWDPRLAPGDAKPPDNAMGLYVAWAAGNPWYGLAPEASPGTAASLGCRLLVRQRLLLPPPPGSGAPPPDVLPGWTLLTRFETEDHPFFLRPSTWEYSLWAVGTSDPP